MKQQRHGHLGWKNTAAALAFALLTGLPVHAQDDAIASSSLLSRLYAQSTRMVQGLLQKFSGQPAPARPPSLTREAVTHERLIALLQAKYPGLLERLQLEKGIDAQKLLDEAKGQPWFNDMQNLAAGGRLDASGAAALHAGLADLVKNDFNLQWELPPAQGGLSSFSAVNAPADALAAPPLFTSEDTRVKLEDIDPAPGKSAGFEWSSADSAPPAALPVAAASNVIGGAASGAAPAQPMPAELIAANAVSASPGNATRAALAPLGTIARHQAATPVANHTPSAPSGPAARRDSAPAAPAKPKSAPPTQPDIDHVAIREGGERSTVSRSVQAPPKPLAMSASPSGPPQASHHVAFSGVASTPANSGTAQYCAEFEPLAHAGQLNTDPAQQRFMQEQLWQFVRVSAAARNFGAKADPAAVSIATASEAKFLEATEVSKGLYDQKCGAPRPDMQPEDESRCYQLLTKPSWQKVIRQAHDISVDLQVSSEDRQSAQKMETAYQGYLEDHQTPFRKTEDRLNYVMCDPSPEGRAARQGLMRSYLGQMGSHSFADTLIPGIAGGAAQGGQTSQSQDLNNAVTQLLHNEDAQTKLANRLCKNLQTHVSLYASSRFTPDRHKPAETRRYFAEDVYNDALWCGGPLGLGNFVRAMERSLRKAAEYCGVPEVKVFTGAWKDLSRGLDREAREWLWADLLLQHQVKNAAKFDLNRLEQTRLSPDQLKQFYGGTELEHLMGGLQTSWREPEKGQTLRWIDQLTTCKDIDAIYRTFAILITNKYFKALPDGATYEDSSRPYQVHTGRGR